jgi:hypothetical protein
MPKHPYPLCSPPPNGMPLRLSSSPLVHWSQIDQWNWERRKEFTSSEFYQTPYGRPGQSLQDDEWGNPKYRQKVMVASVLVGIPSLGDEDERCQVEVIGCSLCRWETGVSAWARHVGSTGGRGRSTLATCVDGRKGLAADVDQHPAEPLQSLLGGWEWRLAAVGGRRGWSRFGLQQSRSSPFFIPSTEGSRAT